VGAAWLVRVGLEVRPEETLVTSGAQHAMVVALATVTEPATWFWRRRSHTRA
jgi:DNA-binding transcriptional MocR family regulator